MLPEMRLRALIVAMVNWYNSKMRWQIVPVSRQKRPFTP